MKIKKMLKELAYNQGQIKKMLTTLNGKVSAQQEYVRSQGNLSKGLNGRLKLVKKHSIRLRKRGEYAEVADDKVKSIVDYAATTVECDKKVAGDKFRYLKTDRPVVGEFYYDSDRLELVKAAKSFESIKCHIFEEVKQEEV